jgi:hypothetical protein
VNSASMRAPPPQQSLPCSGVVQYDRREPAA